jgi:RCC1 and BTB domain-containing protein
LDTKKVVLVAANGYHTACITDDGDTYTWGEGQYGNLGHGDEKSLSTPKLVNGLAGKKAKEVACGRYHTIVSTEDGRVYSFGRGSNGQLGHCNFDDKLTPTLIKAPLEGKNVVQVACGYTHSMALTSDGHLYTWGDGEDGRLGHGSKGNICFPCVVESLIGHKVVDISSSYAHSVALVNSKRSNAMKRKAMVNDETCSDIVFLLKDGERVHANKGILIGQSEYFRAMFRSDMRESKENEVHVQDCSKALFLLLLEYLYVGEVDIVMEDAIELYVLSDRYREEDLSRQCLEVIERGLSHENAFELLAEVDNLGLDALKEVCMEHVVLNYGNAFRKETLDTLSPSLKDELLTKFAEMQFTVRQS